MTDALPLPFSPLVSADWLVAHLNDPRVRVLDARFELMNPEAGAAAYRAGHLPGAVYAGLSDVLSGPKTPSGAGGRHPLPDPEVLAAWLGAHCVRNDSVVVAYDDPTSGHGFYAARAWWLLRWLGHDRVFVLDGGLPAYLRAGGPLTTEVPSPAPTTFTPHVRADLVASADEVGARGAGALLVDSRAPARYRGDTEPLDRRAGHIPGALNRDWSGALREDGTWRTPEEQAARLDVGDAPVTFYCGSGVSATPNLLALELAGRPLGPGNRLYSGSWSDWVSDEGRPVETGG
ncbi:sulfurtransferase [Deinococcus maricopensis]|uniref:3-mercaptopyruvate sulfurtransferase n=1 Tax=Deinococcus maricopensis (strain DSM 21211 / LMG 22137 / NRRL B-23946 / LB-34) TaxID=709986 RepID=E8UBP7_DEIML|nr:sulfurtransferase [Deinococcus maricopensis]ADV68486.1 3-mercaptopyruvate sulfurtransferase [Deinococcus maricopensis DSM 21211]